MIAQAAEAKSVFKFPDVQVRACKAFSNYYNLPVKNKYLPGLLQGVGATCPPKL